MAGHPSLGSLPDDVLSHILSFAVESLAVPMLHLLTSESGSHTTCKVQGTAGKPQAYVVLMLVCPRWRKLLAVIPLPVGILVAYRGEHVEALTAMPVAVTEVHLLDSYQVDLETSSAAFDRLLNSSSFRQRSGRTLRSLEAVSINLPDDAAAAVSGLTSVEGAAVPHSTAQLPSGLQTLHILGTQHAQLLDCGCLSHLSRLLQLRELEVGSISPLPPSLTLLWVLACTLGDGFWAALHPGGQLFSAAEKRAMHAQSVGCWLFQLKRKVPSGGFDVEAAIDLDLVMVDYD